MDGNLLCNCHLPATGQKAAPAAGKARAWWGGLVAVTRSSIPCGISDASALPTSSQELVEGLNALCVNMFGSCMSSKVSSIQAAWSSPAGRLQESRG